MPSPIGKPKARLASRLLILAGILAAAVSLAACGSSSSSSSSSSSTSTEETTSPGSSGGSGGSPETTTYVSGIPTLEELYEGTSEAPPTTGPKAVTGKEVIIVSCGQESPGCLGATEDIAEGAKTIGWKEKVVDGKLNVDNGYSNAIRTATASSPDAIVLIGINCNEAKTAIEEAKAAGIAVAVNAGADCGTGSEKLFAVNQYFNKKAKGVLEFFEQYGENQAAYVMDKTEGKAKVILVEYLGLWGKAISRGWAAAFGKCSECEVLDTVGFEPADLAPGGPLSQRFETTLTKDQEANSVIISLSVASTYTGLAKEIVDSGRADQILSVTGEGLADAMQLIGEGGGGLNASGAAYDQVWSSWGLVDNLNRYFNNEEAVPQGVGFTAVDAEHNLPPKGENYTSAVPYKKAYEAIWSGK